MKLNPAPTKALSSSIDRFSSIVQPKTFPPRQSVETFRPERPSIRSSMPALLICGYLGSLSWKQVDLDRSGSERPHRLPVDAQTGSQPEHVQHGRVALVLEFRR